MNQDDTIADTLPTAETRCGSSLQSFVGLHSSATLYLGDCLDIAPKIAAASCDLLLADPPYGMGKENDGVMNDNLYGDKLDAFLMSCWRACRPALKANASAYIWGNAESLWRLWYRGGLEASERLTMRNELVWNRGINGAPWDDGRMYQPATERALFFMLGEQGFNNNADNFWEGWEPIRAALDADRQKMGWTARDIERITGVGMFSHWFTRSQWTFIPENHYQKLQAAAREHDAFKREHDAFKREHDELKREHDELKREFYATRSYFDNRHQNMSDVWHYGRVTGAERHGHATPKPVAMMARCVKSSCPPGGTVLDPFMGTAPTAIACLRTGRNFIGIEKDPKHFATACSRLERELEHGALL